MQCMRLGRVFAKSRNIECRCAECRSVTLSHYFINEVHKNNFYQVCSRFYPKMGAFRSLNHRDGIINVWIELYDKD